MTINVGDSIAIDHCQLAIITGCAAAKIQAGHAFNWGMGGTFEVASINDHEAVIRRLGSQEIQAMDQTGLLNPTQFDELAMWDNPEQNTSMPSKKDTSRGRFTDITREQSPAGDVMVKIQVFPKELKSPHPPLIEGDDRDRKFSSLRGYSLADMVVKLTQEIDGLNFMQFDTEKDLVDFAVLVAKLRVALDSLEPKLGFGEKTPTLF